LDTVENKMPDAYFFNKAIGIAMELQGTKHLLKRAPSLYSLNRIPREIFIKYVWVCSMCYKTFDLAY